ncbi:unnamed protein product, partial [Rhizopus stolonifer]
TTKKRGPPKGYIESLENRLKKMENLLGNIQNNDHPHSNVSRPEIEEPLRKRKEDLPVQMPTSLEYCKTASFLGSSSGYYLVRDILSSDKEVVERMEQFPRISSVTGAENTGPIAFRKINTADNDVMLVCDKTLAEHVGQVETDRSYINPNIAPKEFLDELVKRFFEIDHSTLPVVEKQPFMDAYEGCTQPPPATILTYAIWAHTCSNLSVQDPIYKKYNVDRDHICDVLWVHVSKIIKLEYLTPRYATIQALVLICTYPNTYKTFHTNWVRGGMAIRMAQELGLHRTMEKLPLTKEMIESRKRLWYCVYITDRWNCACMGRPLAISDADCDIELPDVEEGGKDYSVFVNFIKLSGILGEILSRICSPKAKARGHKSMHMYHTVQSIHAMLDDWSADLPLHLRIDPETTVVSKVTCIDQAGPLMICYHVVLILLHRTFLVSNKDEILPELFSISTESCATSAKSIIDIARILSPTTIAHFGWNFAGYAVFQASLIHLYNSTNPNPELANLSRDYIQISVEECIKPLINNISNAQKNILNILQAIMDLTGVNKEGSRPSNSISRIHPTNNDPYSTLKPGQSSAMSMHTIVSNWESNVNTSSAGNSLPLPESDMFAPNNASTAAWQSLFASTAAPFIGDDDNWQAMLTSLFDEVQTQPGNNIFNP